MRSQEGAIQERNDLSGLETWALGGSEKDEAKLASSSRQSGHSGESEGMARAGRRGGSVYPGLIAWV